MPEPLWETVFIIGLAVLCGAMVSLSLYRLRLQWKCRWGLSPSERGAKELERLLQLLGQVQDWLSCTEQNDMIKKIRLNLCRLQWNAWLEACSYVALHSTDDPKRQLALRNLSQVEDNESAQRAVAVVRGLLRDPETPQSVARVAEAVLRELKIVISAGDITVSIEETREAINGENHHAPDKAVHREKRYDAFLCHASEDKGTIVRPFAAAMQTIGLVPWLDEGEVQWGDNLVGKIQEGLSQSRFVVVFLSDSFLRKRQWTQAELNTALSIEIGGKSVVLPVLCGIDHATLRIQHPLVAAKLCESIPAYQTGQQVDPGIIWNIVGKLRAMIPSASGA